MTLGSINKIFTLDFYTNNPKMLGWLFRIFYILITLNTLFKTFFFKLDYYQIFTDLNQHNTLSWKGADNWFIWFGSIALLVLFLISRIYLKNFRSRKFKTRPIIFYLWLSLLFIISFDLLLYAPIFLGTIYWLLHSLLTWDFGTAKQYFDLLNSTGFAIFSFVSLALFSYFSEKIIKINQPNQPTDR